MGFDGMKMTGLWGVEEMAQSGPLSCAWRRGRATTSCAAPCVDEVRPCPRRSLRRAGDPGNTAPRPLCPQYCERLTPLEACPPRT